MTGTTPVPNELLDRYLKDLHGAELSVVLIIIRQTLGWEDRRSVHGRKKRDWISVNQSIEKSGYSRRAISLAIDGLVTKKLINVFDGFGNALTNPSMRQGKQRLFYGLTPTPLSPVDNVGITSGKPVTNGNTYVNTAEGLRRNVTALAQKMLITK